MYLDGHLVHDLLANALRSDVPFRGQGHVFTGVPPLLGPGSHSVVAYVIGVNSSGMPDGDNPSLNNSPRASSGECSDFPEPVLSWCQLAFRRPTCNYGLSVHPQLPNRRRHVVRRNDSRVLRFRSQHILGEPTRWCGHPALHLGLRPGWARSMVRPGHRRVGPHRREPMNRRTPHTGCRATAVATPSLTAAQCSPAWRGGWGAVQPYSSPSSGVWLAIDDQRRRHRDGRWRVHRECAHLLGPLQPRQCDGRTRIWATRRRAHGLRRSAA
ncbi:MAG: hypothetical protein ACJATT_005430 [Myxococcota bacterium]|jgi:hypothetical protein